MRDDSLDPASEPEGDEGAKVYVSLASLATADGTTPEMGDEVQFQVTGNVKSLEGDVACITPTMIDGEPAPNAPMRANVHEDMHDSLMRKAAMSDEGY